MWILVLYKISSQNQFLKEIPKADGKGSNLSKNKQKQTKQNYIQLSHKWSQS